MNRKSVVYSGVLHLALIFTSVLLNRDVVPGLTSGSDVTLSVTEPTHLLGQDVIFNGSLVFANDEHATISQLTLQNVSGPQAFQIDLPVFDTGGVFIDLTALPGSGDLGQFRVKITVNDVVLEGGGGSLPGSENFKGSGSGSSIDIAAIWTPPAFLDLFFMTVLALPVTILPQSRIPTVSGAAEMGNLG